MREFRIWIKRLGDHWGALVTGGTIIGTLGIWQGTGHTVPVWAYWVIGGLGIVCASFLVWRDAYRTAVQAEGILKEIEDTKPNLILRNPGAKHIEDIDIHDGRVVFFTGQFVKVRIVNRPSSTSPNAVAKEVVAKIKIFDANRNLVLEMDGRWDDKTPPMVRAINSTARDFLVRDFGIEDESNIDIAFFNPKSKEIIAHNNDNYNFPQWRNPHHLLSGDRFTAEIRLVAIHVDVKFSVMFGLNEDRTRLRIIETTAVIEKAGK
jgi:hypothetical protein